MLAEHGDDAKVLAGGQSLVPAPEHAPAPPARARRRQSGRRARPCRARRRRVGVGATRAAGRRAAPRRIRCWPGAPARRAHRHAQPRDGRAARSRTPTRPPSCRSHSTLLGGSVVAASARGRREMPAAELLRRPTSRPRSRRTSSSSRRSGRLPATGWGFAFEELAQRGGDYALCMAARAVARATSFASPSARSTRPPDRCSRSTPDAPRRVRSRAGRAVGRSVARLARVPPAARARRSSTRRASGRGRPRRDRGRRHGQRPPPPRGRRAAAPAVRLPPPHARPHRNARRLRARRLRRVHGAARRRGRALVPACSRRRRTAPRSSRSRGSRATAS